MSRKSPTRHRVRSHKRDGKLVKSYRRGSGKKPISHRKRVVTHTIRKAPNWLLEETKYVLKGIRPDEVVFLRMVGGTGIFIGSSSGKDYDKLKWNVNRTINENFRRYELERMNTIGIFSLKALRDIFGESVAGMFHGNLPDGIMITMDPDSVNPSTVIHELIHGLDLLRNLEDRDIDEEEKKTELETVARITNLYDDSDWATNAGYYSEIPKIKRAWKRDNIEAAHLTYDAIEYDRRLLTGSLAKRIIGGRAVDRVNEVYPQSRISKAKFSPGERLDRYFIVERPGEKEIDVHIRFDKVPDENKVISGLIKLYGDDVKIWEWKDGVKVMIQ